MLPIIHTRKVSKVIQERLLLNKAVVYTYKDDLGNAGYDDT